MPPLLSAPPPSASGPAPEGSDPLPLPPDSPLLQVPWFSLDRPGLLQALAGLILGLIALLTSYDHITFAGVSYPLPQQWGIPCIAASVATVFIDAELATRSRLRAADAAVRAAQDSARAADEAAEERDRAAEARERQRESLERLDQAALLSARVQLDPSAANRKRLWEFLALRGQGARGEGEGDEG
ncbi:MAG: hypothetical protein VKI83_04560 [Synechococcaceae cyanobacterium]|nr:hypothetical protein [Synechococcaceae cyanobacterium]